MSTAAVLQPFHAYDAVYRRMVDTIGLAGALGLGWVLGRSWQRMARGER